MSIAFDAPSIRRVYKKDTQTWWFSVIDLVQVLTQQADYQTARKYWNRLKERLSKQGSESVTNCHRLTLPEADGKQRLSDAATAETLLRLVQSVPHLNVEPFELWLAKLGDEYMQEMADPALLLDRARQTWQQQGRGDEWITQRMTGQVAGDKPTDHMSESELIFAALAELSARQVAESVAASGMVENKSAAQSGDHIAAQTRQQLDRQMSRSVVSGDSPQKISNIHGGNP